MNSDCLNWNILRAYLPIMFVWFTMTDDGGLKIPLSNWRLIKNCTTSRSASCCWQFHVHLARRKPANATRATATITAMMMMMSNSVNKMQVIKLTSAMSFTTMLIILWQNKHHVLPAMLFAEEIVISEYVISAVFREMSGMDSFRK